MPKWMDRMGKNVKRPQKSTRGQPVRSNNPQVMRKRRPGGYGRRGR
jgi:hypothetical protein